METTISEYLKKIGSAGGKARAKKLTKEQLSEIGKKGGKPKKAKLDK